MTALPLNVALLDASAPDEPGSMRAYADVLEAALRRHGRGVACVRVEVGSAVLAGRWSRRLSKLAMLWRVVQQRHLKPDLWHVLDGSHAFLAAALPSRRLVVTAHDIIPCLQAAGRFVGAPAVGGAAKMLWRFNAARTKSSARIACVSERTRMDLQAVFGVDPSRMAVVPLPVRGGLLVQATAPVNEDRIPGCLLHVGSNAFYKHRRQVLQVFGALPTVLARSLVMVGPPPTADLLGQAKALGIAERVQWIDDADDVALSRWYRSARVLLFPSLYEGYGWPVLEAMANGLPFVASNGGSLPEVVGDASAVYAPDDTDGMVRAAARLLDSGAEWEAASNLARSRAALFTERRFAEQMSFLYVSAAGWAPATETA